MLQRRSIRNLFSNAALPSFGFSPRLHHRLTSAVHLGNSRQPIRLRRQASGGMRHGLDHILRISGQGCRDGGHICFRIVGITLTKATEQEARPLRCVFGQRRCCRARSGQ